MLRVIKFTGRGLEIRVATPKTPKYHGHLTCQVNMEGPGQVNMEASHTPLDICNFPKQAKQEKQVPAPEGPGVVEFLRASEPSNLLQIRWPIRLPARYTNCYGKAKSKLSRQSYSKTHVTVSFPPGQEPFNSKNKKQLRLATVSSSP